MIGRDFEQYGINGNIFRSFGDSRDSPFAGPVKVRFVDKNRLAVIDKDKGLHIQNLNGNIEAYIMPTKKEPSEVEKARDEQKKKRDKERDREKGKGGKEKEREEGSEGVTDRDSDVIDLSEMESVAESECVSDRDACVIGSLDGDDDSIGVGRIHNDGGKGEEDGEPTNYMDLMIMDLCRIPMTTNIAVCDILTSSMKQVDRMNWVVERNLGEKRSQFDEPQLKRPSGISSFQLGFKVFYAVIERCNRLQILSEGGKTIHTLSKSGLLPGEFEDPVGIATYVAPNFIDAAKRRTPDPTWYLGIGNKDDLSDDFDALENKKPGDFLIIQRESNESVFDGKYVTPAGLAANVTIVKSKPERDIPSSTQLTMNASNVSMMPWPSVWEAVANCPAFVKAPDPRPYVLIAVNDKGNHRVQVFKYFWMSSELFLPAIVPFFIIGGVDNGCNVHLVQPQGIAFTPSGEIAVCDDQARQISIVSCVSKNVVRVLNLSFINYIENIDIPSVYHNFPLARTRDQRARDQAADDEAYRSYLRNLDPHVKQMKKTKRQFLGDEKKSSYDPWVTSIDFSPDGKLAIGYRMGGILVLNPYKLADVGTLTNVEHDAFNLILDFCEYSEYEALRECCTTLHNYTARRRQNWSLLPLGGIRRKNIALAQFMKWAKVPGYMLQRVEISQKSDTNPLNSTLMNWVDLMDVKKRVCCINKWLHPESNVIKGYRIVKKKKEIKKKNEPVSFYLRKKEVVEYEDKKMLDYKDVDPVGITQSAERDVICSNLVCPLSHELPVYEPHYLKKFSGYVDLSSVLLAVSKLFGDVFLYKNEAYITHIFEAFSEDQNVDVYHDPMTRDLKVIREKSSASIKCVRLQLFMELMLMCEEEYTGAKPFRRQFLFHRLRMQRKFVPPIKVAGPAMDAIEHGNLVEVIKTEDDLGCLLHANEIIQYRDGINVPYKKSTNKVYKKVDDAEKNERGVNESYKLQYNKAFILKADRCESMLDKMFS